MRVIGLDDREYIWSLKLRSETENKSQFHLRCRYLLKDLYPVHVILEEVYIPGSRLYLDFYASQLRLAIEVHGEQHFNYTPHFHGSERDFMLARHRDQDKIRWCEINNISIVVLPHWEEDNVWRERIINRRTFNED
jgi:hypothetical protein